MKVFERDGIFSLGISIPQHLELDKNQHPERIPVEHLEKVIQQKAEKAKPEIQKLLPKLKFQSQDFQLIKDGEFQGGTQKFGQKCTATKELKNHKQTSGDFFFEMVKSRKERKMEIEELIGVSFKGLAFCNLSALFLNSNNKSIRLVAEDVGVLEIHERK